MVMILIMAFLEMISVVSILPFMVVLTNPTLIETNLILNTLFKAYERQKHINNLSIGFY